MASEIRVKEYKSQSEYGYDAQRMAAEGWRVISVVSVAPEQQRSGCLRMLVTGFLTLMWKPSSRILVTYSR
jgi:hypothetical protein